MPNHDDEFYIKVALDASDVAPIMKDLSKDWDKHNQDVAKAEKAYRDYGDTTVKVYEKVNKKIKDNIGQVVNEGKALQTLEKQFGNLSKKNEAAFDTKKVQDFNKILKETSQQLGTKIPFNIDLEDIDSLTEKLNGAKNEVEATQVVVAFFEEKLKNSEVGAYGDKFKEVTAKIASTRIELEQAQERFKLINETISSYENRPVAEKKTSTFVDLKIEQSNAKKVVEELTVSLMDQEKEFQKSANTSVNLTTQLRNVKDEMVKLELEGNRGSDRWNELSDEANKYNTVLKETNAELNRTSSSTAGLDNLIGAVSGVVGVFTAAEGAAALFGGESEDLKKATVKLVGAIALLNGLQAIQAELAKKDAIATRALTYLRSQYTVATNSSATATLRLGAALKLLGIGLVIGGIAALVVYWKDIAKFVGITSDKTERLNEINKTANELYGEQTAELKVLVEKVKEGNLSFDEKEKTLKKYNETFSDTFGTIKTYTELEKKLIEQGDSYIKYLGLKAKAEAAYQLAIEKSKEALEKRTVEEVSVGDYFKTFIKPGTSPEINSLIRRGKQANDLEKDSDDLLKIQSNLNSEMEALANELGLVLTDPAKNIEKDYKSLSDTLESLIKKQRDLKTGLIGNDREREKQVLQDQIADEKAGYAEKIKNIELSEEKKMQVIQEFNRLYNEETGIAYEDLRKNLKAIDDKYNAELEKVKLTALQAIDEVFLSDEERQRKEIETKFDAIRKALFEEIDKTNDAVKKEAITAIIFGTHDAQDKETKDFDLNGDINRVNREKKTAEAILKISQINNKAIIDNEQLKQIQLLLLEEEYFKKSLNVYRDSLKDTDEKSLFQELINTLATSVDTDVLKDVAEQLKETFGEEVAQQILEMVEALKDVKDELIGFGKDSKLNGITKSINEWTSSLESFSKKLSEVLLDKFPNLVEQSGVTAKEFADSITLALSTTLNSLKSIFDAEINGHKEKLNSIQDTINGVEDQLEREKELYEQGYANNYEARSKDLENLKEQKKKEEEELKKAQKRKAALAKAELLADAASQIANLITASSNIFKWASAIPFVGVPLAIGLIATMFGAFAAAKTKAFQSIGNGQNFRTGLQKGRVSLSGPSHEEGGYGVHDSRTGNKVAEVENNEDLIVLNKKQQRSYNHLIDAMIADSRGGTDLETSLRNHYNFTKSGPVTMGVVERVNTVIIKAQTAKGDAAKKDENVIKEIKEFKEMFRNEFFGYKEERDNETKTWETSEFYHVKKGNTTKKYPKK